jgi:hypothetical protein
MHFTKLAASNSFEITKQNFCAKAKSEKAVVNFADKIKSLIINNINIYINIYIIYILENFI